jgi:hypothetical protein
MAEHDQDRMVEDDRSHVRDRNIVRDGGIAREDAEMEDVTRDTYSTPIGSSDADDRETTNDDRTRAGDVLGIADVTPDSGGLASESPSQRRRRADDLIEGGLEQDPSGIPYEGPDDLKVRD